MSGVVLGDGAVAWGKMGLWFCKCEFVRGWEFWFKLL